MVDSNPSLNMPSNKTTREVPQLSAEDNALRLLVADKVPNEVREKVKVAALEVVKLLESVKETDGVTEINKAHIERFISEFSKLASIALNAANRDVLLLAIGNSQVTLQAVAEDYSTPEIRDELISLRKALTSIYSDLRKHDEDALTVDDEEVLARPDLQTLDGSAAKETCKIPQVVISKDHDVEEREAEITNKIQTARNAVTLLSVFVKGVREQLSKNYDNESDEERKVQIQSQLAIYSSYSNECGKFLIRFKDGATPSVHFITEKLRIFAQLSAGIKKMLEKTTKFEEAYRISKVIEEHAEFFENLKR